MYFPRFVKSVFGLKGVGENAGTGVTVVHLELGSVSFQGPHCWESCQLKGVRSKFELKKKEKTTL